MPLLLSLALGSSSARATEDCELVEQDYRELRRALRDLRRAQGQTVVVAGQGKACDRALQDILRNDPLLAVQQVEPAEDAVLTVEHALGGSGGTCGAVLEPSEAGWRLRAVGTCASAVPTTRRIVSVGYWMPQGVSIRWNEDLTAGLSALVDVSTQVDPLVVDDGPSWRLLGGVDITQGPLGNNDWYLGFRAGAQEVALPDLAGRDVVTQFVAGRKWVGKALALQLAGGVMALVPLGEGIQDETLHPVFEVRVGMAPRR